MSNVGFLFITMSTKMRWHFDPLLGAGRSKSKIVSKLISKGHG